MVAHHYSYSYQLKLNQNNTSLVEAIIPSKQFKQASQQLKQASQQFKQAIV
jgi:hypothetical protein